MVYSITIWQYIVEFSCNSNYYLKKIMKIIFNFEILVEYLFLYIAE